MVGWVVDPVLALVLPLVLALALVLPLVLALVLSPPLLGPHGALQVALPAALGHPPAALRNLLLLNHNLRGKHLELAMDQDQVLLDLLS